MHSILREFFHGNISPEEHNLKRDSECEEVMGIIYRTEEKLLKRLNEEEKEILQEFSDAQMELNHLTAINSQIYGYKLGLTMTAEAFLTSRALLE